MKNSKDFDQKSEKKWKKSEKNQNFRQKKSKICQKAQRRAFFGKKVKKYLSQKIAKNRKTVMKQLKN